MKRNFLTGIAMMVAAFFVGTEIAVAADVSLSGSIRTRYENEAKSGFVENDEDYDLTATQVRLNAKANINADTSAFIQMQSAHTWGASNSSYTASDADASVGIHQAYFTLKNFAGSGFNAKVGRQEIVMDGHRLFGHTGWTTGAQTHDAARFSHSHGNQTITYAYMNSVEDTSKNGAELDIATHLVHGNFQGVLGGGLSTYLIFTDDDCGISANSCTISDPNQWYTLGLRQAGKMFGLDYRAEYYFQTGAAKGADEVIAPANIAFSNNTTAAHTLAGYTTETTREAYMFGVRVGKSFKSVAWTPKITLWYDYLSGNSDENMNEGTWSAFDTHFDTGHKFYGFMDLFLGNTGANTNYMGLQDLAVKVVLKPAAKWTLKADLHNFRTAESVGGNPSMATRTGIMNAPTANGGSMFCEGACSRDLGNELGSELDLTLVHAYNPNVKLSAGYSMFMAETLYHLVKGTSAPNGYSNQAHWAYVQAAVKF